MKQNKLKVVTLTDKQELAMKQSILHTLKHGVDCPRLSRQERANYMAAIKVEAKALGIL